ncbi:MAG TPA: PIN domain-containing protein [Thermoplasmata archaeon]|nr:PIN domain-containing protein [Thermoplasmata archaeon]
MAFILDTSFVISVLEGDTGAADRLKELRRAGAGLLMPAPAYYELRYGYEILADPAEHERFQSLMPGLHVPAFDRSRAAMAARLRSRLRSKGRETGAVDSMILSFASSGTDVFVARDGPLEDAARAVGIQVDHHT